MKRTLSLSLLAFAFLALRPNFACAQEEDVEAFSAEQMVTANLRGGENVKYPKDPLFGHILTKSTTLADYNRYFAGQDEIRALPPKVIERVKTNRNVVYLTFDDGPYVKGDGAQATTDELLEIMDKKHVTGTFFLQGRAPKRKGRP